MGNCASSPSVKDGSPSRSSRKPSRGPPSRAGREAVSAPSPTPYVPPPVDSLPPPLSKPEKPSAAVSAPPTASASASDVTAMARKSKSMEISHPIPSQKGETGVAGESERVNPADADSEDEREEKGEWKVRRRVSRRLSLEVQKRKKGVSSPPLPFPPTAADQEAWEAQANADLLTSAPGLSAESRPVGGENGKSRLGREGGRGRNEEGEEEEGEEEEEVPGSWRAKRRGRRLSLEVDKPPDLALLAAIRRSSSAPIQGALARRLMEGSGEWERESGAAAGIGSSKTLSPVRVSRASTGPDSGGGRGGAEGGTGRGSGESALMSPSAHFATVIDFARLHSSTSPIDAEVDDGVRAFDLDGERYGLETPSSVRAAELLVGGGGETPGGSPRISHGFRAKRRKSRRLSLEIEKKPDEALLAAVRRTHSVPSSAEEGEEAVGTAAWAAMVGEREKAERAEKEGEVVGGEEEGEWAREGRGKNGLEGGEGEKLMEFGDEEEVESSEDEGPLVQGGRGQEGEEKEEDYGSVNSRRFPDLSASNPLAGISV